MACNTVPKSIDLDTCIRFAALGVENIFKFKGLQKILSKRWGSNPYLSATYLESSHLLRALVVLALTKTRFRNPRSDRESVV